MDIQKEKDLYLAELLEQEAITQDEFKDIVFWPEINAFHSNCLSSRFIDNINFGWSVWQAAKAKAVPEWISVEDKEPDCGETVLICWSDSPEVEPEKDFMDIDIDTGALYWSNYNDGDEPSHWMPLPQPVAQEQMDE